MRKIVIFIFAFVSLSLYGQETLDDLLKRFNKNNVPYISVQELAMPKTNAIVLDARELDEFNVSHLRDAIYVGYDNFKLKTVEKQIPNKDEAIVVYCTLGVRSEVIANRLKKAGYTNVKNLFGGIIEWKNKNFDVYNIKNKATDSVHVCSSYWGKWLKKGKKVYPKALKSND
ncbi:rhodanese-like domain-containing protein [Psychroserpens luteolus]|uniref:rhodanese-like domain-containing protein n=1 Tax=Psychroserpens luteolus TaxID=2855840 RepID=UPI001E4C52C1|nr:rhodanese-like domain-containing protein [Psychroserpens luteolus]MCD2257760.1 rhodanese-like domain-containing protein [Psychroserpens luteolus]